MNLKKLFFMLTFFVLLGTTAFAQTYVSATNGDDTFGDGSIATPYRSIQKAINVAATGSTISVEAGIYNSTVVPTEGAPITMAAARSFTFVGTSVGLNTTVTLTDGFTLNHASAVADFQTTGTATFNFGTTATALILTAGTMNIATANVTLGSGATMTVGDGVLNTLPTKGTNLSVIFNGANAVASTSAYLPSSLGSGTVSVDKTTGTVTIDNTTLSLTNLTLAGTNTVNVTVSGSLTVAANGDITQGGTGTLTIGNDASSTLTMSSTTAVGLITVNAGGSVVINSNISYSVKNAGTSATAGSSASYAAGNIFALTAASNLTVNGNITFNNTNVAALNGDNAVRNSVTLSNASTGTLSIVGSITTPLASTTFADVTADAPTTNEAFIDVILSNTSTGSFATRTAATRGATGTNGVINTGAGTMTLGQAGDTFSTSYDVQNSGATAVMTVNAAATFGGTFTTVNAASLVELKANTSIAGLLTHAGLMKINANTLTLSNTGAGAFVGAGKIYSTTSATVGSGWVKFTGAAPVATFTGELPNVEATKPLTVAGNTFYGDLKTSSTGGVTISGGSDVKGNLEVGGSGTITTNGATTVRGNVNMTAGNVTMGTAGLTVEGTFSMPQGTFTFGANTLTLVGNFNRTGGTVVAGTGTLAFAGTASQTFTPGTQMNVGNVTVTNTGNYLANVVEDDKVTITASLIVLNNFTITTGRVVLGTSNIRMQQFGGTTARFSNGGRGYSATGVGGLIFEGTGANPAGAGDGAVITGAQPYSNIYVRLSVAANNVLTLGAVKISGVVTFDGGGIEVGAAADAGDAFNLSTLALDDALVIPTVVINTQNAHGSPFFVTTAPTVTSVYNLSYTGQTAAAVTAADFITTKVNNFSILAGTAGKTITFMAAPGAMVGSLTVDAGDILALAAQTLTASGNTAAHAVNGTVNAGTFEITGNATSLTGGSGTTNASSILTLLVDPATTGTFTSTGMKVLTNLTINKAGLVSTITMNSATATIGAFVNTAGTTTLNMNSTISAISGNFTVTANAVTLTMNGAAAGTRTIAGNLAVNGGSLTLGSHINVTGTAAQAGAGSLVLGDYNLTLADTYTHAGTGTITAGTGAVVAAVGAAKNYTFTSTVNIPNFTINSAGFGITFVTNGLNVTNKFIHTAGSLDLNSLPLTISGDTYTFTAGTYANTGAAATGIVNLTGAALTVTGAASPIYPFVNVNSTGTVTLASSSTTTPRNFTVSTAFTHTKGNIVLGFNDLLLTDDGAVTDATYTTVATAGTVTGTATGTNLGEVVFGGANGNHAITMADNYSVQNVKVSAATTKGGTKVLTVGSNFTLGANFTFANSARLVLGDGANIIRSAGIFDEIPTFGTTVNVNYTLAGALNSAKELPVASNVLNNLTITSGAPVITANTTVNGTLFLVGGTISTGTKTLTIVADGTINRSGGAFAAAATDVPTVTTYKLVYSGGGAAITTGKEFVSSATAVTSLTVTMSANGVVLSANRTVGAFAMSPTGAGAANIYFAVGTDAATLTFTVAGPTTIDNGIVSTADATAAITTDASSFVAQGSVTVNGGSFGALGTDNGAGVDGGLNLTFGGSVAQSLTLTGNITIPNITMNSTGTTAAGVVVNVTGGNLTITNLITFQNGILNMGTNTLILPRPNVAANSGLAYDRSAVTIGKFGHVVGKISRQALTGDGASGINGRFEFPVGTLSGQYRPAFITFTPSYVVGNQSNIIVEHKDVSPEGTLNLPLDGGNGVSIGAYPAFYWLVSTSPSSFSNTQNFDLDLQANNIGVPYTSDQSLRIIRRQDGSSTSNGWLMQGLAPNYGNYQVVSGTDTTVVARTTSGAGGLILQGSRFSIGVPARAPSFTAPVAATFTVAEGATTANTIQFTAVGLNTNDGAVTYNKISGPTWAALNATTGLVTLTPGYTDYSATAYTLVVRATTASNLVAEKTVTITVTNTDRGPVLAAATATVNPATATTGNGVAKALTYTATDADGDAVTYAYTVTPTPSAGSVVFSTSLGTLTFTPAYADVANSPFTFVVTASSGTPVMTATVTTVFTVTPSAVKGDVNLSGTITVADALLVLNYVVNPTVYPLTAEQIWAADVNNDGVVGAYDAASILVKAGGGAFLAKQTAAAGTVSFSKFTTEKGVFSLPINIENTAGVKSFYSEVQVGTSVEFTSVASRLPEGWVMASNFENGTLKIAMAGLTPLTDGAVAYVNLSLKDKDASVSIQGNAILNDQISGALNAVKIREIPSEFSLSQNYPNPFNPTTSIKYAISENARVNLVVYNILGQAVRTLVNAEQESGYYTVRWDGTNDFGGKVSSGIYIYRISAGNFTSTVKMNLLK